MACGCAVVSATVDDMKGFALPRDKRRIALVGGMGVGLFALCFAAGLWMAGQLTSHSINIPGDVARKVDFPLYLPKQLPGTYQADQKSFIMRDSTFMFAIKDTSGNSMVFTEQRKLPTINFARFYEQQFKAAEKLSGTPYPSVSGKSLDEKTHLLSIEAPETWLLVAAPTTNPEELLVIARSIAKYLP